MKKVKEGGERERMGRQWRIERKRHGKWKERREMGYFMIEIIFIF